MWWYLKGMTEIETAQNLQVLSAIDCLLLHNWVDFWRVLNIIVQLGQNIVGTKETFDMDFAMHRNYYL